MTELERPAVVTVPVLLSLAHVGELLDCSARTVRRRIHDGSLAAVVEHDRLMVRGDDLRTYIDGLARHGNAPRRRRRNVRPRNFDFLG